LSFSFPPDGKDGDDGDPSYMSRSKGVDLSCIGSLWRHDEKYKVGDDDDDDDDDDLWGLARTNGRNAHVVDTIDADAMIIVVIVVVIIMIAMLDDEKWRAG
jgi:hypothetical protein